MFKFKGISSTDMQVIIEEEEHFIARAAKRYEVTEIEGRDGAIFDELGYSYVERPIYVQCLNIDKIDDILAWLDGEGEFEYKWRKTIARFYSELNPERDTVIRIIDTNFIRDPFWTRIIDTNFIRDPFWTKIEDNFVTDTNNLENTGNIYSRPILRLEKTDYEDVDIEIAGIRFQYTFEDDEYVEIDCEEKTALYEGLNRNRQLTIGYEFPKLSPGNNVVTIKEGGCTIKAKRKDRWLW